MRCAALLLLASAAWAGETVQGFDTEGAGTPYALSRREGPPGPVVEEGRLLLLDGKRARGLLSNAVAFDATAKGAYDVVEARFDFTMTKGAHGAAFALLDTRRFGTTGEAPPVAAWEEPNLEGTLAIGLDTFNPPTSHWFDAQGNVHGRPQREVSLHWDGRELASAVSAVEFRDGETHRLELALLFEPGGVVVTLAIDGSSVWKDRFFAGPESYESRAAFGARTGLTSTTFSIDNVAVRWGELAQFNPRKRVRTFDGVVMFRGRRKHEQTFALPGFRAERIILTLTLEPGPGGWDKWDVGAAIYAWEGDERFEIVRYITPYRRAWTWRVDVTDYQSILRGETKLGLKVDSWQGKGEPQKGFQVTVDLDYYQGAPRREAFRVFNIASEFYTFGNDQKRIDEAFPEVSRLIDEGTKGGKLRLTVTGHGQWGEFTAAVREASCNGQTWKSTLWKKDVYLNPVRPQSGTWKFDRAGWAPGDIVRPWEIDVTRFLEPGKEASIRYRPLVWEVPAGKKIQASHWVEAQLILYR